MSDLAIGVKSLSKLYQIGRSQSQQRSLREGVSELGSRVAHRARHNGRTRNADSSPEETIWALEDVSFEVRRGEVVGLIGRNGAGKSTLLKLLARITEPTSGKAEIHGRVGSLLEVGTGFHPELTGRENIYLNGAILGMRRRVIQSKFDEIIAFSEIERFLDTPVKHYSSGMYVRLAFAVAAHLEPEILLVDEVLAVGDVAFQKKCLGKIGEVTRGGRTVIFVSHNLYAIQTICERAIWLDQGRIRAAGITGSVAAQYQQAMAQLGGSYREAADKDSDEARIVQIRINGAESRHISLNGTFSLSVEFDFDVTTPLALAFGVSLHSAEGIYLCGLATHLEGATYHAEPGRYTVRAVVPDLTVASGTYTVRVTIMDAGGNHTYCRRSPAAILYVDTPFHFDGLLNLNHRWDISGSLQQIVDG